MKKGISETILYVKDLNAMCSFYVDILNSPPILVNSSFMNKFFMEHSNWIFTIKTKSPFKEQKIKTPRLTFFQNPICLETTLKKLQRYKVKYEEIFANNSNFKIIEAIDIEGNVFFLESHPELKYSEGDELGKTQKIDIGDIENNGF